MIGWIFVGSVPLRFIKLSHTILGRAFVAMAANLSPIVIDNNNLQVWEARPYILKAKEHNYKVEIREPQTPWKKNAEELAKKTVRRSTIWKNLLHFFAKRLHFGSYSCRVEAFLWKSFVKCWKNSKTIQSKTLFTKTVLLSQNQNHNTKLHPHRRFLPRK